jgi:hypothetical protein
MWKSSYWSAASQPITRPSGDGVQRYGPELEQRLRVHLKATNKSWRVDETYLRVKGRWCYLYRAIDSAGATIDFPVVRTARRRCCQTIVSPRVE